MIHPMNQLVEFIKAAQASGQTREQVYTQLLTQGYTVEQIAEAFAELHATTIAPVETQKRTVQIISYLGAVLVGAGIFSFIALNWQVMPATMKVTIILTGILVFNLLGWWLEKASYPKTALALYLLGAITYGGGIFLVAQIYNIRANWPDGFILWALGTLLLAWATEAYALYWLALPVSFIPLVGHVFMLFTGFSTTYYDSFALTSPVLLVITTIVFFAAGWQMYKRIPAEVKAIMEGN